MLQIIPTATRTIKPRTLTIAAGVPSHQFGLEKTAFQKAAAMQWCARELLNSALLLAVVATASLHLRAQAAPTQADATVQPKPVSIKEAVTVTAYRTPLGTLESPTTSRLLSRNALETTPAVTLDGDIRQLPGVELFRRSSSLVANPSSQGVSLRGLGSTSASRTLVTEDDVPLNDVFGGWIHWEEQPELSVQSVELVRGGASDLYGSSAIGGVINLVPSRPTSDFAELRSSYGSEGTYDDGLLLQAKRGPWGVLAGGGSLGTDGYIQEAPSQRGPVDIASNMHSQNGVLLAEHVVGPLRLFVRAGGFNEARGNGTPLQTNGTRIWRYATGGDWQGPRNSFLSTRLYGSTEHYRQTFSNISNLPTLGDPGCSYRCGEKLTKFSLTPDNELGAAAHWNQPLGAGFLIVAGADVHDVRVWDREQSYVSSPSLTNLHDHQRDSAAYAELMWVRRAWTMIASGRMDWFQNYDGRLLSWNGSGWVLSATQPAQFGQRVFNPRLGLDASSRITGPSPPPVSAHSAHPRPTNFTAPLRWATSSHSQRLIAQRTRHRLGDRPGDRVALGNHSLQLLPHPGQPSHHRGHHQPKFVADPVAARKSWPDRKPRRCPGLYACASTLAYRRRRLSVRSCHGDERRQHFIRRQLDSRGCA